MYDTGNKDIPGGPFCSRSQPEASEQDPELFPVSAASIWLAALERLETIPMDDIVRDWLQEASLTPDFSPHEEDDLAAQASGIEERLYFWLVLPNSMAPNVLTTHLQQCIEDILADLTGQTTLLA